MGEATEFGNSLNDRINFVRDAFDKAHRTVYQPDGSMEYLWVTDVFDDHVIVRSGERYFRVGFKEKDGSVTFSPRDKWTAMKLDYVKEMWQGHFRDHMVVTEFKGKYPEVKIFDDVDIKELTAGEKNPTYVTLPIGMAGVTSGNKRHYNDAFVKEMENQVIEKKPIGLMGHLNQQERSFAFPAEAVHWIGCKRVNEILWGKGYVPSGEPRERLGRYKATNKKIATSIDASADGVWDSKLDAYVMIAETLSLGQIDIAPADRAGISNLAAVPLLTTEMIEENVRSDKPYEVRKVEDQMGKEETVRELTAEDISLLPQSVRDAMLQEFRKSMGIQDGEDPAKTLKEARELQEESQKRVVKDHVAELAAKEDGGIKVQAVREMVISNVLARNPKSKEEAATIYGEVSKSPEVTELLSKIVQETMGPPQRVPNPSQQTGKKMTFFVLPGQKN